MFYLYLNILTSIRYIMMPLYLLCIKVCEFILTFYLSTYYNKQYYKPGRPQFKIWSQRVPLNEFLNFFYNTYNCLKIILMFSTTAISAGTTCSKIVWECILVLWPQIVLAMHKSNWFLIDRKEKVQ